MASPHQASGFLFHVCCVVFCAHLKEGERHKCRQRDTWLIYTELFQHVDGIKHRSGFIPLDTID